MSSSSQCPQCGPLPQKSLHYELEYHTSVPLQRLRASNLPATDEEIAHVQTTFISNIHRDRVCLEAKFAVLSRVAASMKEECDALRSLENKYQDLLSSRRALPHELLSNIFLYARFYDYDFDCLKPSGIIWQLSHVCRAWRDVALSLDAFWSRIAMTFDNRAHTEKTVQLLQFVLSRSKLLDINLYHASSPLYAHPIHDRLLDMVLAQSHRWRSAHLVENVLAFAVLYAPLRGRLPQLASLTVTTFGEAVPVQIFEDCPLLTKVALSSCAVTLPLSQIIELQLGISPYALWYEGVTQASLMLIRQCPLLKVLCINIIHDENVQAVVTTPNVYKLETNSGPIIDNLVVPLLREAILSEPSPNSTRSIGHVLESFIQLLRRSDCTRTLTSLKIDHLSLGWYDPVGSCPLISILAQTTRLAVLELDLSTNEYATVYRVREMEHVAELMRALQIAEGNPKGILLPCLSSMKIVMANDVDPSEMPFLAPAGSNGAWGDFAVMLKARWEGSEALGLSRLHTLHVALNLNRSWDNPKWTEETWTSRSLLSSEEQATLDGLVEAGMNLDIQFTLHSASSWDEPVHVLKVPSHSIASSRRAAVYRWQ
ncbi:hypothetical protein BDZ89DRAFT_1076733 [Hymenopellis radicata]|nr:hypothetical protein BDZ89DRAFT_1076733 [Hymenopellis radicata]